MSEYVPLLVAITIAYVVGLVAGHFTVSHELRAQLRDARARAAKR